MYIEADTIIQSRSTAKALSSIFNIGTLNPRTVYHSKPKPRANLHSNLNPKTPSPLTKLAPQAARGPKVGVGFSDIHPWLRLSEGPFWLCFLSFPLDYLVLKEWRKECMDD